jgi:hypothetical protein
MSIPKLLTSDGPAAVEVHLDCARRGAAFGHRVGDLAKVLHSDVNILDSQNNKISRPHNIRTDAKPFRSRRVSARRALIAMYREMPGMPGLFSG